MSRGKKWLWRLFLLGFVALVTMGLWLPPIISRTVEKDYDFPEVTIDATVLPNGACSSRRPGRSTSATGRSRTRTST